MCSTDNEISIDENLNTGLKHLPKWPPVNLEFRELVCTVPDRDGPKTLLKGISGEFRSSQFSAILGPSGAGKTTLLNILAGYRTPEVTGTIYVNGKPRHLKTFCKMSRYIMQQDLFQPMLTVREAMIISADLKLGKSLTKSEKLEVINEILELLRLTKAVDTMGHKLSGGERKRLSIALELVNNPPVLFLDEPTTGLDDISCAQCISLLQRIAYGGRTVICSIHTPTAKIFQMFDSVYILTNGQCAYQGHGSKVVPYCYDIGLRCPLTYNPADFVIEVCSGEYGDEYIDKMIEKAGNGKYLRRYPRVDKKADDESQSQHSSEHSIDENSNTKQRCEQFDIEINPKLLKAKSSNWDQFLILYNRQTKLMWRNSSYMKLKIMLISFIALVVGGLYQGIGNDSSKALFNFGYCFTLMITFMYNPLMPVLLQFPNEIEFIKREHFNQWYRLAPYYLAMLAAKLPMQIILTFGYVVITYTVSAQPLEWQRLGMVCCISFLVSIISENLGTLIASRLSLINGMFVGPVLTVPLMLLAVYGIGFGKEIEIPVYMRIIMSFSYLRYGLEGLIDAMYGYGRGDSICPETEQYCLFNKADFLKTTLGFSDANFFVSVVALFGYYLVFTIGAFYVIKIRLSASRRQYAIVQYVEQLLKTYFNFTPYKY